MLTHYLWFKEYNLVVNKDSLYNLLNPLVYKTTIIKYLLIFEALHLKKKKEMF